MLFWHHIFRYKPSQKTIIDADFPALNPNDILTIIAYFRTHQVDDLIIGAYHYVAKFCRCNFELAHLFETEKYLASIDFKLPEVEILAEGPIDEPMLGLVYL